MSSITPGRGRRSANQILARATGYRLTRATTTAPRDAGGRQASAPRKPARRRDRLVTEPVFLLCPPRSGSTLLRVILNSHSQVCAPHELHLRTIEVAVTRRFGELAMTSLGLDQRRLEYLLWDRILHRELTASGKGLIVDKTPNNVFDWERLQEAWPRARYVFLIRHPQSVADSLMKARTAPDRDEVNRLVNDYVDHIEAARAALPALTVRYEDLVTSPEVVTRSICEHIGVGWEAAMLDYGAQEHGAFKKSLGDWHDKIKSGAIDPDLTLPPDDDVHEALRDACRVWGYLNQM
jgi:hypothetical protein